MRVGVLSDSFACFGNPFPPIGLPCSSLDIRACAWSYCNLISHVWLIPLGWLHFSEGKGGGMDLGGERESLGGEEKLENSCGM